MNDDCTMARMPELRAFAQRHDLKVAKIADLISYRLGCDKLVERDIASTLHTRFAGDFRLQVYTNVLDRRGAHRPGQGRSGSAAARCSVRVHALNVLEDVLGEDNDGRGGILQRRDGGDPRRGPRRRGADPRSRRRRASRSGSRRVSVITRPGCRRCGITASALRS